MSWIRRIANLFSREDVDREIDAELRSHIEMRIEDNLAAGMTAEEARRDALVRFGNRAATKEKAAGMDAALTLESIWSDLRFALRQLVRNPGFAFTAIVVLALGMGASVAIFAFVDAALIEPLPYSDPARLVGLFESTPLGQRFHLSYLDYLDWKRMNNVFSSIDAFDNNALALGTATGTQQADGAAVSAGFFRTLGVHLLLGRDFRDGEDRAGAAHTVLLSYGTWQNRYGGQRDVVGKTVTLDGAAHAIIGVLPSDFYFAPAGPAEYWTAMREATDPDSRGGHGILAVARLKDGVSLGSATAEMNTIARQLAKQYPDADAGRGATVVGLAEVIVGNLRPILLLLQSGAGLLLLIACVNVSSLVLVRSESRQREMAVRGALGASHARLARQFATESLTLAGIGSLLALGAAYGAMHLLLRMIPENLLTGMPFLRGLGLNPPVLVFAGTLTLVAWPLLSITPMARLSFSKLQDG